MQSLTEINRTYTIDETYFGQIDTQEKAYWLGFLWADGCISKTTPRASGPNRLRIAQKWSEIDHLMRFQAAIQSNYPIKQIRHPNNRLVAQLDINCRPLCEQLQKLGYDVKTKRVQIPAIDQKLLPHFMRGYFDGDGALSIYHQTIKKWTIPKQEWSLTGNKTLMHEMKGVLTKYAGVTSTVSIKYYKKSPDSATVRYGKKEDIAKLYNYLYTDATIYLETKHRKFIEFFSRYAS